MQERIAGYNGRMSRKELIAIFLTPPPITFFFSPFVPLPVGLGDPSDLAPLIGGLLFLFGFTSQGGTTILPPSRTITGTHKHLNYSFKVYMCAHKYTRYVTYDFFFSFSFHRLNSAYRVSVFTVVVDVLVASPLCHDCNFSCLWINLTASKKGAQWGLLEKLKYSLSTRQGRKCPGVC